MSFGSGFLVLTPIEAGIGDFLGLLDGAILAIAYFTSVSAEFKTTQKHKSPTMKSEDMFDESYDETSMDISKKELAEKYQQLSDDELIDIARKNTLYKSARDLLRQEFLRREIIAPSEENDTSPNNSMGEHTQYNPGPWVTVAQFTTGPEAHILRARLESEEIPAIVADEHLVTANWFLSNAIGGVRVRVPQFFAEQASTILKEIENGNYAITDKELGNDIKNCPKCGSQNITDYKRSWKIAFLFFYFLHVPTPYKRNQYKCNDCHNIWEDKPAK